MVGRDGGFGWETSPGRFGKLTADYQPLHVKRGAVVAQVLSDDVAEVWRQQVRQHGRGCGHFFV